MIEFSVFEQNHILYQKLNTLKHYPLQFVNMHVIGDCWTMSYFSNTDEKIQIISKFWYENFIHKCWEMRKVS